MNLRMPFMPVSMRLEGPPRLNDGKIITSSTHKLQPDRKVFVRESTGNGHCRKTADIPDATERIGEDQTSLKMQTQGRGSNRIARCGEDGTVFQPTDRCFLND